MPIDRAYLAHAHVPLRPVSTAGLASAFTLLSAPVTAKLGGSRHASVRSAEELCERATAAGRDGCRAVQPRQLLELFLRARGYITHMKWGTARVSGFTRCTRLLPLEPVSHRYTRPRKSAPAPLPFNAPSHHSPPASLCFASPPLLPRPQRVAPISTTELSSPPVLILLLRIIIVRALIIPRPHPHHHHHHRPSPYHRPSSSSSSSSSSSGPSS